MNDLITGIQFLTRIPIKKQQVSWSVESFGRSVKYFPLVGGIIGAVSALFYYMLDNYLPLLGYYLPPHVLTTMVLTVPILVTGGIHCDGFMDTMDGIFSGRPKERMLEIMKDSRVGANGVTAFIILMLFKWSLLMDIPYSNLPIVLFLAPIMGRFAIVIGVTGFPYARQEGMGKAFVQYAGKNTLLIAVTITFLLIVYFGTKALIGFLLAAIFTVVFYSYVTRLLGGLTGDVYGAMSELSELLIFVLYLV